MSPWAALGLTDCDFRQFDAPSLAFLAAASDGSPAAAGQCENSATNLFGGRNPRIAGPTFSIEARQYPFTWKVTNDSGAGPASLTHAMQHCRRGDIIQLAAGRFCLPLGFTWSLAEVVLCGAGQQLHDVVLELPTVGGCVLQRRASLTLRNLALECPSKQQQQQPSDLPFHFRLLPQSELSLQRVAVRGCVAALAYVCADAALRLEQCDMRAYAPDLLAELEPATFTADDAAAGGGGGGGGGAAAGGGAGAGAGSRYGQWGVRAAVRWRTYRTTTATAAVFCAHACGLVCASERQQETRPPQQHLHRRPLCSQIRNELFVHIRKCRQTAILLVFLYSLN